MTTPAIYRPRARNWPEIFRKIGYGEITCRPWLELLEEAAAIIDSVCDVPPGTTLPKLLSAVMRVQDTTGPYDDSQLRAWDAADRTLRLAGECCNRAEHVSQLN